MTVSPGKPLNRGIANLLRSVSRFLLVAGILSVGYSLYVVWSGRAYQAIELRKFKNEAPLAEPHLLQFGDAIGILQIPNIGLETVILYGDSPKVLRLGVGHLPETSMPGEKGNVVIAGHRDTFFRPLRSVRDGDLITIRTQRGTFLYQIESTAIVSPKELWVLQPSDQPELTLLTCYPFDYVGPAPNRFVVRAKEITRSAK